MDKFLKDNWFKITIAVAVLVVALSVGYYFFIFMPKQNREAEKQKTLERDEKCKSMADDFIKDSQKNIINDEIVHEYITEMQVHFNKKINACLLDFTDTTSSWAGSKYYLSKSEIIVNLSTVEFLAREDYDSAVKLPTPAGVATFYHQQLMLMSE